MLDWTVRTTPAPGRRQLEFGGLGPGEIDGRESGVAGRGHHRPWHSLSTQLAGSCWSHAAVPGEPQRIGKEVGFLSRAKLGFLLSGLLQAKQRCRVLKMSLLGAADLITSARPVSGILVGRPAVLSGQCRSIRRRPVSGLHCNRDSLWFYEVIGMVPVSRRGILGC